ncbi:MAG: hypothetical protein Q4F28_07415 [Eubacteriales bacterium]|nr:hypothetical protein [Eubacteriales bacterium]
MKSERLQWHVGFCAAMRTELEQHADELEFINEYSLTKKPLQPDLLIIRKHGAENPGAMTCGSDQHRKSAEDSGGLQGLLAKHTLFEYKGPDDTLGIDDFYKVMAYAGLYKYLSKGENSIKVEEMSVVFVVSKRPLKLLKHLEKYYKIRLVELEQNVYRLEGPVLFTSYLVIAGRGALGNPGFPWLNALNKGLTERDRDYVRAMLDGYAEQKDSDRDAVIDLLIRANESFVNEIKEENRMCQALLDLMAPEINEAKRLAALEGRQEGMLQGRQEGMQQGAKDKSCLVVRNMFARGYSAEDASGIAEVPLEQVKQWFAEWSSK